MSDYLLNTNILSEVRRPHPNGGVLRFLSGTDEHRLSVSVLTLGEFRSDIVRIADPQRRDRLDAYLTKLRHCFAGRLLEVTVEIAEAWGACTAEPQSKDGPRLRSTHSRRRRRKSTG